MRPRPTRRCAGASAPAARGWSRGRCAIHRKLEERLAEFKHAGSALLFGSGLPGEHRRRQRARGQAARSSSPTSSTTPRSSTAAGSRSAETFVYRHNDMEHLAWALERASGRGALIVTDSVFSMDGDVAPLAELVELARRHRVRLMVDEAHGVGCIGPGGRGAVHEAGLEHEVDVVVGTLGKALGALRRLRHVRRRTSRATSSTARARSSSRPRRRRPPSPARSRRSSCSPRSRAASSAWRPNGAALRDELAREGFDVSASTTQIVPLVIGDADAGDADLRAGDRARRLRAGDPPADGRRGHVAPAPGRDGHALARTSCARPRACSARAALQAGFRPGDGEPAVGPGARRVSAPRPDREPRRAAPMQRRVRHRHGHRRRQDRRRRAASRPRCARAGCASRRSSRSSPGSTSPSRAGRPITSCSRAAAGTPPARVTTQHVRAGRLAAPGAPSSPARALDPAALVAGAQASAAATPTSWSPRASAGCSSRC